MANGSTANTVSKSKCQQLPEKQQEKSSLEQATHKNSDRGMSPIRQQTLSG